MRKSIAALVLIHRMGSTGEREFLVQWNSKWRALNLIGGHKEDTESFYDCCVREIQEELGVHSEEKLHLLNEPLATLQYTAPSESANELTEYTIAVFAAFPVRADLLTTDHSCDLPATVWVKYSEIVSGQTAEGLKISRTIAQILNRLPPW